MDHEVWLLPVDHRNMRAFYSRGLVVPRSLMEKYRRDLLELAPTHLTFLAGGISVELTERSSAEGDGIPVLIQVGLEHLIGSIPIPIGDTLVRSVTGIIPTGWITAVHVRSEDDAREIRARDYRNIDAAKIPLLVSPKRFLTAGPSLVELTSYLESLDPSSGPSSLDTIARECVAGALQLLLDGLPARALILSQAANLLTEILNQFDAPPGAVLTESVINVGWLEDPDDYALFNLIIGLIVEQSGPQPPVAGDLVRSLQKIVREVDLIQPDAANSYLQYTAEILRGNREMGPFKHHGGLRSLKAFTLFLLRPDPSMTKTWFDEDMNMEDAVGALALMMAGLSRRAAGIPVDQRGTPELMTLLMQWVASINSNVKNPPVLLTLGPPMTMMIAEQIVGRWELQGPSRREVMLADPQPDSPSAIGLCTTLGWFECLETVVESESLTIIRSKGGVQAIFRGAPKITVRVAVADFALRLSASTDDEVDSAMEKSTTATPQKPVRNTKNKKTTPENQTSLIDPATEDGQLSLA